MYTKQNLAEMSGKTGIFIQFFITLGTVATSLFGLGLNQSKEHSNLVLMIMISFPIFTCLIRSSALMTFVNYDTPKFYIIKKKFQKAK